MGTRTYIRADNNGHQLLYIAQARICNNMLDENIKASPASTSTVIAIAEDQKGAKFANILVKSGFSTLDFGEEDGRSINKEDRTGKVKP